MTELQIFRIGELIAAVLVFAAMLSYVDGVASDSTFEQNFMARDAGLLIDTAYAAPGNVTIKYDTSVNTQGTFFLTGILPQQNFTFYFGDSRVDVFAHRGTVLYEKPAEYFFGKDENLALLKPHDGDINELPSLPQTTGTEYQSNDIQKNIIITKSDNSLNISFEQPLQTGAIQ